MATRSLNTSMENSNDDSAFRKHSSQCHTHTHESLLPTFGSVKYLKIAFQFYFGFFPLTFPLSVSSVVVFCDLIYHTVTQIDRSICEWETTKHKRAISEWRMRACVRWWVCLGERNNQSRNGFFFRMRLCVRALPLNLFPWQTNEWMKHAKAQWGGERQKSQLL